MSFERKVCVENTAENAVDLAAELVKITICESLGLRSGCCVALSGGSTPQRLYQRLAQTSTGEDVPWGATEIFFGDERDVSLDDVASNYRMAQRTLLDHLPIEPQRIHPIRGDADDLDAAATEYEKLIRQIVPIGPGNIPRFDLILLGMGSDGHTASLFPGSAAVNEVHKLVVAHNVPVVGRRRITFTLPLINAARNVILFVTGDDKADAVAALLSDDPAQRQRFPVACVQPTDGLLTMVFDTAAARRIKT